MAAGSVNMPNRNAMAIESPSEQFWSGPGSVSASARPHPHALSPCTAGSSGSPWRPSFGNSQNTTRRFLQLPGTHMHARSELHGHKVSQRANLVGTWLCVCQRQASSTCPESVHSCVFGSPGGPALATSKPQHDYFYNPHEHTSMYPPPPLPP